MSRRSCDTSAEDLRHISRRPLGTRQLNLHTANGARAGSRTLNLGIKRLGTRRVRECQRVSGSAKRTWIYDAAVSVSLTECRRVSA